MNTLLTYSDVPYRAVSWSGVALVVASLAYLVLIVGQYLIVGRRAPSGITLMLTVQLLLSGAVLACLGVLGAYLFRIFREVLAPPALPRRSRGREGTAGRARGWRLKRITLLQSNYLPWRGYFDFMAKSDEFIVYDSCQYTVNDWRNRNQMKTHDGVRWITVPVITKGRFGQRITDAEVVDHKWVKTHLVDDLGRAGQGRVRQADNRAPRRVLRARGQDPLVARDQRAVSSRRSTRRSASGAASPMTREYGIETLADLSPSAKVAELVRARGRHPLPHRARAVSTISTPTDFTTRGIAIDVLDYSTLAPVSRSSTATSSTTCR